MRAFVLAAMFVASLRADARADETYHVVGHDSVKIGSAVAPAETTYEGSEVVAVERLGTRTKYTASVTYQASSGDRHSGRTGRFVATISPSGEQQDDVNADPDQLTLLNQPFAIALDAATIRGLEKMHGPARFQTPSPITGDLLRGELRYIGTVNGLVGVAFTAHGTMHGTLPERPGTPIDGTIALTGTAYYRHSDALLRSLDAALTIVGSVESDPLRITYDRTFRADEPQKSAKAARR